ncbi:IS110 family transposase [uncultured Thiodictyon sp.]|jgi:transposase|uniref:IS110 family transposase n=1 Tax=uncultured Thiodictyon sp. TaxID=1846217 RepID=UPI0025DAC81C|nr:IS110 family transposase [uncultured Thiodictyon sp.]
MTKCSKEPVVTIGIDLAKNSVHVYGVDAQGHQVLSKKVSRGKLSAFMVNQPPCLVAMEACGSAHHWARVFRDFGHEVRLIAPQFVKPFVKSNKNDAVDAEAICEAVQRPNMRFVAIKTVEQQDIQAIHRMRSLNVERRTAQVNQVRGLLLEYGIEIPQGRAALMRRLPEILEEAENGLSERFRAELNRLLEELRHLDEQVAHYDTQIQVIAHSDETVQRLMTIPGIGALIATALMAAVGEDVSLFRNGRGLAAWLGLVPRQHSTGGRERLLGISKRGDVYLRQLIIHGARAVMRWVERKEDATSRWATALKARRHTNVAVVAMANKIARVAYAVMVSGKPYDPAAGKPLQATV